MRGFSWTHLVLSILIIIFAVLEYNWLVVILAAVMAILSIFGVCSCSKRGYYNKKESYAKKEIKPAKRKR